MGQANQILESIRAKVVGCIPLAGMVILEIPDPGSVAALMKVIEEIERDPSVVSATADMLVPEQQ